MGLRLVKVEQTLAAERPPGRRRGVVPSAEAPDGEGGSRSPRRWWACVGGDSVGRDGTEG